MKINYTAFNDNGTWILSPNQVMRPGHFLKSRSGQYTLSLRDDANLVLNDGNADIWIANADHPFSDTLPLHKKPSKTPITFVVSHSGFLEDPVRERLWRAGSTDTRDKSAWFHSHLCVQDDGNILIMDIRELWTGTPTLPLVIKSKNLIEVDVDVPLIQGQQYDAGAFKIVFQTDGNLVILDASGNRIWTSATENKGAASAVMQSDGNFVIRDASGGVVWQTNTAGNPDAWLAVQDNGKIIILKETITWARFGFAPGRRPYRGKYFPEKEIREEWKPFREKTIWYF